MMAKRNLLGVFSVLVGLACGDSANTPLGDTGPADPAGALGSVSIEPQFPEPLPAAPSRIELTITGTDSVDLSIERQLYQGAQLQGLEILAGRNRFFALKAFDAAGELVYTGVAHADIEADGQIQLDIDLWPLTRPVSLTYLGAREGASERFALKAHIPYAVRVSYIRQITVELIDALTGVRTALILSESGLSEDAVRTRTVLQLDAAASFFLRVHDTDDFWRIDIEGY